VPAAGGAGGLIIIKARSLQINKNASLNVLLNHSRRKEYPNGKIFNLQTEKNPFREEEIPL
jgi:hypothetical protein